MSKLLVTGAGGFIGSHLVEKCTEMGYDVKALLHYNSQNYWGWLEKSPKKNSIEIVTGDVRDYDSVASALKGCDSVFHLAALIGIPYSYISPLAYIRTNIEGTYNILQASKACGVSNVIITSTSETYGSAHYVPMDEKHPVEGRSPYSASKISADQLAISYYRSFDLPVKIVRPFNTYGPRQSARAIIPTIITQIAKNINKVSIGNLEPTRDFTFVTDTVNGFIEIFQSKILFGEVTNIGMNEEISVGNLAKLIADIMKVDIKIERDERRVRVQNSEVDRLRCDNTKLCSTTSWENKMTLREGLERTIEWMRSHIDIYKTGVYNV
jgi:NAD dependent epimerase/dehydratase